MPDRHFASVRGEHLGRRSRPRTTATLPEVGTDSRKEYTSAVVVQEKATGMGQRVVRNQFVHLLHFTGDGF